LIEGPIILPDGRHVLGLDSNGQPIFTSGARFGILSDGRTFRGFDSDGHCIFTSSTNEGAISSSHDSICKESICAFSAHGRPLFVALPRSLILQLVALFVDFRMMVNRFS
jgi:hypothetical protein